MLTRFRIAALAAAASLGAAALSVPASAHTPPATVLTPYGRVPRSDVVQVDNHQALQVVNGQVEKVDLRSHAVVARLGAAASGPASADPFRHAASLRAQAGITQSGTPQAGAAPSASASATDLGGNCPADWGPTNIQSFKTTWTVPPKPSDSTSTTTFFIWNGLAGGALQPVLQWGNGTAAYQIANWYYVGGKYAHGTYLSVSPGTSLTGRIDFVSQSNGTYTYKESFAGYPSADVTVNRTSAADGVIECFEPYTDGDATKNPDAPDVAMKNISLTGRPGHTAPPTIAWTGNSSAASTKVVDSSSSNGEVDLYFNGV
ncbi:hypothetical protein [Streptomyces sp. NBC_01089]|uniref:hypothetical protein n=1 Tax=Streptomyces sp. NBC_01089 TaxID=2903747 RepID=UPI00386AB316|nr:hypothetical protein OG510_32980 [Streptomyces sp. NBC_01089]